MTVTITIANRDDEDNLHDIGNGEKHNYLKYMICSICIRIL